MTAKIAFSTTLEKHFRGRGAVNSCEISRSGCVHEPYLGPVHAWVGQWITFDKRYPDGIVNQQPGHRRATAPDSSI